MNPQMQQFIATARRVTLRPAVYFAKRIRRVQCMNPKAKIQYHYDRIYRLYFIGGGYIDVTNDDLHFRGAKAGKWCVAESVDSSRSYYDEEQFRQQFNFARK
jgi:hypothetical protein